MLETIPPESILSEEVMDRTHVSKGSLYYHFETFQDLIEEALIFRFSSMAIDPVIKKLIGIIDRCESGEQAREQFLAGLPHKDTEFVARLQMDRIRALSRALSNKKMAQRLSEEQERVNKTWDQLYRRCLKRGWADPGFSEREVSLLIQGLTLVGVIDLISMEHVQPAQWKHLKETLISSTFFGNISKGPLHSNYREPIGSETK